MGLAEALLVTPVMPAAGGNGLAMRAGLLLEGLARAMAVRVLVVPVFGPPSGPSELVSRLATRVDMLPLETESDPVQEMAVRMATPAGRARLTAVHPLPALSRMATVRAAQAVADAAAGASLVLAMRLYLAPFLDVVLDSSAPPPVILDVDDIESASHSQLGLADEAERFAALEAHYLSLFDLVLACSEADATLLRGYDPRALEVVPNAVRAPRATAAATAPSQDLLFVGNLSYAPNAAGVRWLCSEVLPHLPGRRAALVGSGPGRDVLELAADTRVTVAADVPDVTPWYAVAAVGVVPLHAGSGTRIKVLEAFAHSRPVVSTSIGVAGLDLGDAVLVADAPHEFAAACRRLLEDPELAAETARRGAQIVRETASVDVVAPRIAALAGDMLSA
jgi:glycosyltransferase involved in cell wall biosynthesis